MQSISVFCFAIVVLFRTFSLMYFVWFSWLCIICALYFILHHEYMAWLVNLFYQQIVMLQFFFSFFSLSLYLFRCSVASFCPFYIHWLYAPSAKCHVPLTFVICWLLPARYLCNFTFRIVPKSINIRPKNGKTEETFIFIR